MPSNTGTNQFADTSNINECLLSVKRNIFFSKIYVRPFFFFYNEMSVSHIIH